MSLTNAFEHVLEVEIKVHRPLVEIARGELDERHHGERGTMELTASEAAMEKVRRRGLEG